jgi:adenylate cyclase class IV
MRPEGTSEAGAFKDAGPGRNLELKCRHPNLSDAREAARRLGALPAEVMIQTDTYFHASNGRLKLRETEGRPAMLIWYDRSDERQARGSNYHLAPVSDPTSLKAALGSALGVRGQVRKRRELHVWHNVRIHLDEVDGIGTLVELEAVLSPTDNEAGSQARLDRVCEVMGVRQEDILPMSNADMLGL